MMVDVSDALPKRICLSRPVWQDTIAAKPAQNQHTAHNTP